MYPTLIDKWQHPNKEGYYRKLSTLSSFDEKSLQRKIIRTMLFFLFVTDGFIYSFQVGFRGLCCPLCPKILTNNSGLRLHMDLHEGKYRYHCKVCQKGFMSSTTLKGHMTRHTGVKEYSCSLCHKEFGHKYSYRKHLIVIHHIQDEPQRTAA